jgi:L-arabinose isomerase
MRTVARPKIGLLGLTLEFYETLAPALRPSREEWVRSAIVPALQTHGEVIFTGAFYQREAIAAEIKGFEVAGADVVIILLLTYSPSQLALAALKECRLPILIWNTQELSTVGPDFTITEMIDNHGVHGTQDLANVLVRAEVPFHFVTSPADGSDGLRELGDFISAAAAAQRLRSLRIGSLGYAFPGMGDFAVDTTQLAATLGCSWVNLPVEDYIRRAAGASRTETAEKVAEYRDTYEIAPDITPADLENTVRAELAIRQMVAAQDLGALTYQFMAFGEDERTSTLPFVAASRLMGEGIGFGGEGDLIAAAGTSFFNWLAEPASFTEIFTIDFAGDSLFVSHMGEANVRMARRDRKVPLVVRPSPITRTRDRQLVLVTSFEPGPATFCALTMGPRQKWRIIAAPVRIEDYGPLPGFYVPHSKLKPAGNVSGFLTAYANAGGPHHNAVCFGDARRRLRFAASCLGADYVEI